jgi:serine/threonine protein kinase
MPDCRLGTPLQAPEVIEQSPDNAGFHGDSNGRPSDGYDEAADIWSLGITAMEVRRQLLIRCAIFGTIHGMGAALFGYCSGA